MSICRLLFQRTSTIKKNPAKRVGLLQSGPHQQLIENLFFSGHDIQYVAKSIATC